jgi:hypothetical protein
MGCMGQAPSSSGSDPLPTYFPAVPSLSALSGVRLGITFDELKQVRPQVTPAPYVGALEVVSGDTVAYRFDRTPDEGRPTDVILRERISFSGASRLMAVEASKIVATNGDAQQVWVARARQLRLRLPHEVVSCFDYLHGDIPSRAATVQGAKVTAGVIAYPERVFRGVTGHLRIAPRVRTFVTSDIALLIPAGAVRTTRDCPSA